MTSNLDSPVLTRRSLLVAGAIAGAAVAIGGDPARAASAGTPGALVPEPAIPAILSAMQTRPIVALGEYHGVQDFHDVLDALLRPPDLPGQIQDIVVEFGSSSYQALVDRFVLDRVPVARGALAQVWRQLADMAWNAPVYEQFFRTVRSVNWMLPAERRIRVLLGQPPVTMAELLADPHDRARLTSFEGGIDRYMAGLVEREVLARGRRALLIGGDGHMLKGLRAPDDPGHLNVAGALEASHPGSVYSVDLLLVPPAPADPALDRLLALARDWPAPSLLTLSGTWLGALTTPLDTTNWVNALGDRAWRPADRRYDRQADAVLWLGPGELITASQSDPAIYHWGQYPAQLDRVDPIIHAQPGSVTYGLQVATAPPEWFAQFEHPSSAPKHKKHRRTR